MLVADTIARIQTIAEFGGRVEGAAELAALISEDVLPPVTPAAFVLPVGLRGGVADAATGLYRQNYSEIVGVVLIVAAPGDPSGAAALPDIDDVLIKAVVNKMAGWAPGDQVGVFELRDGDLLTVSNGSVMYRLNFAINDQLRIAG